MSDFYQNNFREYHQKTFYADMSSILMPLAGKLRSGVWVLDVGCGSGRDLLWLKKQGFHVIGFDQSPGLSELARKNAECEVITDDFESYDFTELSVDAVVLIGALVHVPHERFEPIFQNIMQALRSEGYVLISLKEGTGEWRNDDDRVFYLWQDESLRRIFSENYFKLLEYFRQVSRIGTDEIWLGYVLEKSS